MLLCCLSSLSLWKLACLAIFVYFAYKRFLWMTAKPDYTGKTVFISGGSSGIGEALAKRMEQLGAKKIIIAARRQAEMDRVKSECKNPQIV